MSYPKFQEKLFDNGGAGPYLRKDILPPGAVVDMATGDMPGLVKPDGSSITVDGNGVISVALATVDAPGIVRPDDATITVDGDGVLSAALATADTAGVVKADGTTIAVDAGGVLRSLVEAVTLSDAVDSDVGGTAASSRAVKTAHDAAQTAQTAAKAAHGAALLLEKAVDLGDLPADTSLDGALGRVFAGTVTVPVTINAVQVDAGACLVLILKNGGSQTVTWGMAPRWPNGAPPVLAASGDDVVALIQSSGGVWYGVHVAAACAQ